MTPLTRALVPAALLAVALTAGCSSGSSSSAATATSAASGTASAASGTASASVAPGAMVPASPTGGPVVSVSPSAGPGLTSPGNPGAAGPAILFAEGGDVRGTVVFRPDCAGGCPLSGDGTTQLWHMTWPTWNGAEAVGTGTEKIDGCDPNCAAGPLYSVRVTVTFSNPVDVCVGGNDQLFWTRASFSWPNGLPAKVSGANAPVNPVNWTQITSQLCR